MFRPPGQDGCKMINLSGNCLGTKGCTALASVVDIARALEEVILHNCHVRDIDFEPLALELQRSTTLLRLDVSKNKLSTAGAECISQILTKDLTADCITTLAED